MEFDERGICSRYAPRIRMYGLRHLGDEQAAQDLVQQVLLAVIEALREGRIEQPDRMDAFVLGTCRNMTWDMRRGDARRQRLTEQLARLPEGWEAPRADPPDRPRLFGCFRKLDTRAQTVVLLTFAEDRSAEEIARALELTPGNVRIIRHRALARLLACMEGQGDV